MYKIMIEIERTSGNTVTKQWVNMLGKTLTDAIIDPTVDLALNKAGKAEFTVPASHPYYSDIKSMKTHVEIFETEYVEGVMHENSIFFGRVSDISIDWYNQKKVTCEGALAFFNDTVQPYKRYSAADTTLENFFNAVLTKHNGQMTDNTKKIFKGTVNLKDPENPSQTINAKKVFRLTNYEKSIDILTEMCLESEGGYFEVERYEENNERKTKLNWFSDITNSSSQHAQFGLNLLSLDRNIEVDDIYTALIPLGADQDVYDAVRNPSGNPSEQGWYVKDGDSYIQTSDETVQSGVIYYVKGSKPLTIKGDGQTDIFLKDDDAVAEYGLIFQTKRWDDVTDKSTLKKKAKQWLKTERFKRLVIECEIADLSALDTNYQPLKIGSNVTIISKPPGIGTTDDNKIILPITEISYDLNNGKKNVTIGTREQVTLSRITKDGKTKEVRIPDARYDYGATDND